LRITTIKKVKLLICSIQLLNSVIIGTLSCSFHIFKWLAIIFKDIYRWIRNF